jgi:hypothetical protein
LGLLVAVTRRAAGVSFEPLGVRLVFRRRRPPSVHENRAKSRLMRRTSRSAERGCCFCKICAAMFACSSPSCRLARSHRRRKQNDAEIDNNNENNNNNVNNPLRRRPARNRCDIMPSRGAADHSAATTHLVHLVRIAFGAEQYPGHSRVPVAGGRVKGRVPVLGCISKWRRRRASCMRRPAGFGLFGVVV